MKKTLITSIVVLGLVVFSYFYVASRETATPETVQSLRIAKITEATKATSTGILLVSKIVVMPLTVLQGEPVMICVENLNVTTSVQKILFAGKPVNFFLYDSKPTTFIPIDLGDRVGERSIDVELSDGAVLKSAITVLARAKSEAPLGIPAKLGGNSTTSQKNLVNNLTKENAVIKALATAAKVLWGQSFQYPIPNPIVTDSFGYTRLTGAYTISHLGTDFRASEGTPVSAMNQGVIKFARLTTVYGNMIVIDHGLGLQTLYAHLSKINVAEGQTVLKGQNIGESGQTGYAEQPHLHISVKINKISVDPIKFLKFFE